MSVHIAPATYETADEVVERLFAEVVDGDGSLRPAGRTVFVKPNVLGAFPPERGITTHPAVLRAVVKALLRRGAEVVVGDNPGMRGYGVNERCARVSGIIDAATIDRLCYWQNIATDPVQVDATCPEVEQFVVSRAALEADLYVSVPKFKTHVSTVITGGIKNSYGLLVGAQKALLHRAATGPERFASAVVDVFAVRPPDLVVMDAVVAMQGKGPSSKDLRPLNRIIAGTNAVEIDAVVAAIMGVEPASVPLLREAHRRGLGEIDLAAIDVTGDCRPIDDFKVPFRRHGRGLGTLMARLLTYVAVGRPTVRKRACVRCAVCARQCPVDAITMTPYPDIDRDRCVLCYCCNEFCEHDAMDVQRRVRLLRRR